MAELEDIKFVPVSSSNIESIGYDLDSMELYVRFHTGSTYVYYGVPESVYIAFLHAPSKGKFHNRLISKNYDYARVE